MLGRRKAYRPMPLVRTQRRARWLGRFTHSFRRPLDKRPGQWPKGAMNDGTRRRLRDLIATYSADVCDEPKRFEALLKDYCAENKRDVSLLVSALKERVPTDLVAASQGVSYAIQRHRLVQRLIDNLGMAASFACWAVDSWAFALGRVSD